MKNLIMGALLAGLGASAIAAPTVLDAGAFTQHYIELLAEQRPELEIEVDGDLELNLKDTDGREFSVGLSNAYRQYLSNPADLEQILKSHFVATTVGEPTIDDETITAIRPVIKPDDYVDHLRQMVSELKGKDESVPFLYSELNDDLNIFYVIDTEHTMSSIDKQSAEEMHLSPAQLRIVATENLAVFYAEIDVQMEPLDLGQDGLVAYLVADGNYEASAILHDPLLNSLAELVKGELIVFIPARNAFLITGTNEPGGYAAAAEIADQVFREDAYVISPHGYVLTKGRWTRYSTDPAR